MASSSTARFSGARAILITGLHNTHALEQQALQIMNRQVGRLGNYPELAQALRRHIVETENQRRRLEEALARFGQRPSLLKDALFGTMGNVAALANAAAQDEIIKTLLANHAFENYEVAAYKSLLVMAEAAGFSDDSGLRQSLQEELAMSQLMSDMVEPITRRYLALAQQNEGIAC